MNQEKKVSPYYGNFPFHSHKTPNGNSPLTASNLKVLESRQQMRSLRPLSSHKAIFYCPKGRDLEVKGFGPYCSTISRALWGPISIWPHSSSIKNSGQRTSLLVTSGLRFRRRAGAVSPAIGPQIRPADLMG